MMSMSDGHKIFNDMCIRLDTIKQGDGQTDRRTDGQTEMIYQYPDAR